MSSSSWEGATLHLPPFEKHLNLIQKELIIHMNYFTVKKEPLALIWVLKHLCGRREDAI